MSLTAAFVLSTFIAAPVPKADLLQQAKQSLQGEWKVLEFTRKGRASERDELVEWKVSMKGNIFAFTSDGRVEETTFTIDPKASPPTINFTKTDPLFDGEVMFGIYKQEGTRLQSAVHLEAKRRRRNSNRHRTLKRVYSFWNA